MTEQQRYRVIEAYGNVELREYADCVVADVTVTGDADQAGNAAFRPLFSYISGNNRAATSIAMTAPVLQQAAGEHLAMTAPVLQESVADDRWTVSFVLPGDRPIEAYPQPTDPRVTLRALPGQTAAALRWSGRWTSANVAERTEQLLHAMAEHDWRPSGDPRWARFDPPWKPPFLRRNEIVMPVA